MLVQLKVNPTETRISCDNGSKCDTCRIGPKGSGMCPGCNGHCHPKTGISSMASCFRECMTCGGGPAAPNSVPAVCCKSPLADIFLDKVERDYRYTPRPRIDLPSQRGIVITQGSVGNIKDPYPPETEAIAVNLRHVWSTRGWFSKDMKSYLKVPKKTKLILLTMTHDDVLERAWDKGLHEEDWSVPGFDYWQPLSFSYYGSDSKMNAYWQMRRTLLATETGKGWFSTDSSLMLTDKANDLVVECAKKIPQVIFNAQFYSSDKDFALDAGHHWKYMDRVLPANVAFWFVGLANPRYIATVKRLFPHRKLYFLAVGPWLAGHKGRRYTLAGKLAESNAPKSELVVENQRTFRELVERA